MPRWTLIVLAFVAAHKTRMQCRLPFFPFCSKREKRVWGSGRGRTEPKALTNPVRLLIVCQCTWEETQLHLVNRVSFVLKELSRFSDGLTHYFSCAGSTKGRERGTLETQLLAFFPCMCFVAFAVLLILDLSSVLVALFFRLRMFFEQSSIQSRAISKTPLSIGCP